MTRNTDPPVAMCQESAAIASLWGTVDPDKGPMHYGTGDLRFHRNRLEFKAVNMRKQGLHQGEHLILLLTEYNFSITL